MSDSQAAAAAPERKLATIVAADVAGYSRIMGENEEAAVAVLAGHREVYETLLGMHRGRLFNTAGDAFLSEFPSAVEAVRFATELQSAIRTRNDQLPPEQRMQFRIGINIGDVVVQGSDLLGDGVNVAARVQTSAEPGGICISGAVFDQIQNKLMLSIQSLGERAYKNMAQPVRTYTIAQAESGAFPTPSARRTTGGSRRGLWLAAAAVAALIVGGGGWWLYDVAEKNRLQQAQLEARLQAERAAAEEARRKAEADRIAAERQAAEDARRRAEEERLRAEAERRRIEEDRRRAEEERQRADAERERIDRERRAAEEARLKIEEERRQAEAQRMEAERQKLEAERRAADEQRQRAEAQRKAAEEQARRAAAPPQAPPPAAPRAVAAAPGGAGAARFNGNYVGRFCQPAYETHPPLCWRATVVVTNGSLSGQYVSSRTGGVNTWSGAVSASGGVDMHYDGVSSQVAPGTRATARLQGTINGTVMEVAGRWSRVDRALTGRFVRQE